MQKRTYHDFKKSRMHQKYPQKKSGKYVPGATTILSNLAWGQYFLNRWMVNEMRAGRDPEESKRTAGELGTLSHYLTECHLLGVKPELDEYGKSFIDNGMRNLEGFKKWEKRMGFKMEHVEIHVASELYDYGGAIDLIGTVEGERILFDIKTSKGIYEKQNCQVVAYAKAYEEKTGEFLPQCFLHMRNGRVAPVWVEENQVDTLWKTFLCCLELHGHKKTLGA